MSILHTINKSPYEHGALFSCLRLAAVQSSILLFENGVYAALPGHPAQQPLETYAAHSQIFVLEPDLLARGLQTQPLLEGIERVDYPGFVDLCVRHAKVVSWF